MAIASNSPITIPDDLKVVRPDDHQKVQSVLESAIISAEKFQEQLANSLDTSELDAIINAAKTDVRGDNTEKMMRVLLLLKATTDCFNNRIQQ